MKTSNRYTSIYMDDTYTRRIDSIRAELNVSRAFAIKALSYIGMEGITLGSLLRLMNGNATINVHADNVVVTANIKDVPKHYYSYKVVEITSPSPGLHIMDVYVTDLRDLIEDYQRTDYFRTKMDRFRLTAPSDLQRTVPPKIAKVIDENKEALDAISKEWRKAHAQVEDRNAETV